jgi:hypothetical protein
VIKGLALLIISIYSSSFGQSTSFACLLTDQKIAARIKSLTADNAVNHIIYVKFIEKMENSCIFLLLTKMMFFWNHSKQMA